jgi:arylsulfatase A-like enzyme
MPPAVSVSGTSARQPTCDATASMRWPGVVAAGTTCDVPVTTLDVAATLLDVGGCRLPGEQHDLASERPERARALQAWRADVKAKMPTPYPDALGSSAAGTP